MATTYRAMVDALEALSIGSEGDIVRQYTQGPPGSLAAVDLPAQWVELPQGEEAPIATSGRWPMLRVDLVVAFEGVGNSTQPANFDGSVDLMDDVITALRGLSLGMTEPRWDIRLEIVSVSGKNYWAVVATVQVEG